MVELKVENLIYVARLCGVFKCFNTSWQLGANLIVPKTPLANAWKPSNHQEHPSNYKNTIAMTYNAISTIKNTLATKRTP